MEFTAVFRKVRETAFVEELRGTNTQPQRSMKPEKTSRRRSHWCSKANRTLAEESLKGQKVIREPLLIQER